MVRVSSHFNFFDPSTVAIISASVEDGDSICCLDSRKDSPIFNIQTVWLLNHLHNEKPKRYRNANVTLLADH